MRFIQFKKNIIMNIIFIFLLTLAFSIAIIGAQNALIEQKNKAYYDSFMSIESIYSSYLIHHKEDVEAFNNLNERTRVLLDLPEEEGYQQAYLFGILKEVINTHGVESFGIDRVTSYQQHLLKGESLEDKRELIYKNENPLIKDDNDYLKGIFQVLENYGTQNMVNGNNLLLIDYLMDTTNLGFLDASGTNFMGQGSFVVTDNPKIVEQRLYEQAKQDGFEGVYPFIVFESPGDYTGMMNISNESSASYQWLLLVIELSIFLVIILMILLTIKKKRYEFGIALMLGAIKKELKLALFFQYIPLTLISLLLSLIVTYHYSNSLEMFWFGIILVILILIGVLITISIYLRKKEIVDLLKHKKKE